MIGHERMPDLRTWGGIQAITIRVGPAKLYQSRIHFSGGRAVLLPKAVLVVDPEFPQVVTEDTEPGVVDLRWLRGMQVNVLALDNSTPDFFNRWLTAIAKQEPAFVAALTHDEELVTWPE